MNYKFTSGKVKTKYPIIGHGNQGTVFKIDDDTVLKVYNTKGRRHDRNDDLEVAKRLERIKLSHFIAPFDIKEKNKLLISYKMKKLDIEKKDVVDLSIEDYIESMKGIREDAQKLSNVGIQLSDLQEHNICISKGKIRIYDFSDYFLGEKKYIRINNDNAINDCFGDFCLMKLSQDNPIFIYDSIYAPFLASNKKYFEDYLNTKTEDKKMTVREYVLSLKK